MSKKLSIHNIRQGVSQDEFKSKFSHLRGFVSATLGVDVRSNSYINNLCGIVEFDTPVHAQQAKPTIEGIELFDGSRVEYLYEDPNAPQSLAPPHYAYTQYAAPPNMQAPTLAPYSGHVKSEVGQMQGLMPQPGAYAPVDQSYVQHQFGRMMYGGMGGYGEYPPQSQGVKPMPMGGDPYMRKLSRAIHHE